MGKWALAARVILLSIFVASVVGAIALTVKLSWPLAVAIWQSTGPVDELLIACVAGVLWSSLGLVVLDVWGNRHE